MYKHTLFMSVCLYTVIDYCEGKYTYALSCLYYMQYNCEVPKIVEFYWHMANKLLMIYLYVKQSQFSLASDRHVSCYCMGCAHTCV